MDRWLDDEDSWRRFDAKVFRAGGRDACHWWLGAISDGGYGKFQLGSRASGDAVIVTAHRYAFQRARGPLPAGRQVRHSCDEFSCQNEAHLLAGTPADNSRDWVMRRGRPVGPLTDYRGAAGRARAIRAAILAGPPDPAAQLAAALAAARSGELLRGQLELLPVV